MKRKMVAFMAPWVTGLLGGWLIECVLCFLSASISPFTGSEWSRFLLICGLCAFLCALIIIAVVIGDIKYMSALEKAGRIYLLQTCTSLLLLFISWGCADRLIHTVLHPF